MKRNKVPESHEGRVVKLVELCCRVDPDARDKAKAPTRSGWQPSFGCVYGCVRVRVCVWAVDCGLWARWGGVFQWV